MCYEPRTDGPHQVMPWGDTLSRATGGWAPQVTPTLTLILNLALALALRSNPTLPLPLPLPTPTPTPPNPAPTPNQVLPSQAHLGGGLYAEGGGAERKTYEPRVRQHEGRPQSAPGSRGEGGEGALLLVAPSL